MVEDTNCPRCGEKIQVEIEKLEGDSQEFECETCGAKLEISYSVSVEVDVDISDVPAAEFTCPEDDNSMSIDGIDEENGSQEVNCDGCGAVLKVSWSDWGRDGVEVDVIQEGENIEEEEEEDDDDEGEGDSSDEHKGHRGEGDNDDEDEEDEEW